MLVHDRVVDAAPAEQAAVDARMQRLDAPVHDFGKAGHFADFGHVQTGVAQRARRAAGRDQADAEGIEAAGEFDESGLVRHADQRAPDRLQASSQTSRFQGWSADYTRRFELGTMRPCGAPNCRASAIGVFNRRRGRARQVSCAGSRD